MKQIVVTKDIREFLQKAFGIKRVTVYRALNFKSNNELAIKVRNLALQKGGYLIDKNSVVTYHDADHTMVQKFGNRIELVLWKEYDKVQVYIDGIWKEEYIGMKIEDFMRLQERLMEDATGLL